MRAHDRLNPSNPCQFCAYMRHYPNPRNLPITGILLYPRNDRDIDVTARSRINPAVTLHIKSLDLTRPWPEIHRQLMGLLG